MMAGSPSENAGIEAMPLLLTLILASAFSRLRVLSAFSCEKQTVMEKTNNKVKAPLISREFSYFDNSYEECLFKFPD